MRPVTSLSRYEQIGSYTWGTPNGQNVVRLRKNNELDPSRVLRGIMINIKGTCVVGGHDATAVLADNIGAIIENISAKGKHSVRNTTDNFINIRGCDLKELQNTYAGVTIFDNSTAIAVGQATYTFDFYIFLDFVPPNLHASEQIGYLLDVPNWSNLEIDIQFADEKNIWNPDGASTFTWSSQVVNVEGRYAMEPGKFAGFGFGLRYLLGNEVFDSTMSTTSTKKNLFQLDNKARIRGVMIKTGVKSLTTTAGNNAYSSLSDAILTNLRLIQTPNQLFREYFRTTDLKAIDGHNLTRNPSRGYAWLDFALDGLGFEVFNVAKLASGAAKDVNLWLQADVAGAANQGLVVLQDSLYYADQIVIPTN